MQSLSCKKRAHCYTNEREEFMSNNISRSEFLKTLTTAGLGIGLATNSLYTAFPKKKGSGEVESNSFKIRGFHIDMRIEIMTMPALKDFAKYLSGLGINALILEYAASYPYETQATITGPNAYTRKELTDFISYCNELGIQVIPLLENLGHVQYILRHERYADLRIEHNILSQVDPLNKNCIILFNDLMEDLISLHPSKYIHLGGDETRHLQNKKFEVYIKKNGVSKLYTQYMKQICDIAILKGKTPLLWADMILRHPEAVTDLPIDKIIFINWIYDGANADKFGSVKALQEKGCTFWGAPALRSGPDDYYLTGWKYHFDNIEKFVPYCRQVDYKSIVMTSWSTSGVYDYKWGFSDALLEMFPVRNVYPLVGFNILVAAYSKALNIDDAIDPEEFVIDYGQKHFGLSEEDGAVLWNYLAHDQVVIRAGKNIDEENISKIRKDFREVSQPIRLMKPKINQKEFEHFRLMADIRLFYLSVRQVEAITESSNFNLSQRDRIGKLLKPLMIISKELNSRFIDLNEGYLFPSELDRLNGLRNERLNRLCCVYGISPTTLP